MGRKQQHTAILFYSEVHITWDEPTIAEHDKLRGTRQKIDEPSTPYHYGSGESSTGSDCESAGRYLPLYVDSSIQNAHGRACAVVLYITYVDVRANLPVGGPFSQHKPVDFLLLHMSFVGPLR